MFFFSRSWNFSRSTQFSGNRSDAGVHRAYSYTFPFVHLFYRLFSIQVAACCMKCCVYCKVFFRFRTAFFFVYACLCSLVAHCSLRSEDNNRHRLNSCFCQTGKVEIFVLCGAHWVKCSEEYYQSHEQSSNTWHSFYCDFEGGKKRDLRFSARKVSNAKLHSALCSFWRFSNSACNTFFVYNRWQ